MTLQRASALVSVVLLVACGGSSSPTSNTPATSVSVVGEPSPPTTTPLPPPRAVFERAAKDLDACYTRGKVAAPKMADGKVTFGVAVERGKVTCVVPSEDTGLTQEVEDCMRLRLGEESFEPTASGSFELPIVVKGGAVTLVEPTSDDPVMLAEVDVQGLTGALPVVSELAPKLGECLRRIAPSDELRVVHVGARVGREGRVECALASSSGPVAPEVRACVTDVVLQASFTPPSSGTGLLSIPIKVHRSR